MVVDYVAMLKEFHEKYDHYRSGKLTVPPYDVIMLRQRLIHEEASELLESLATLPNLDKVAKELADLLYVVFGTAVSFGIPIDRVFEAVHRSNMTKSLEKNKGKTTKGIYYEPPDIKDILYGTQKGAKKQTDSGG